MKIFFLLLSLLSFNSFASFAELFGASFTTSMIGSNSNLDANDPSNNYYAPSLLGFSNKVNLLLEASSTATNFNSINNVVVTNSTNSTSGTTYGNVSTSYPKFYGSSIHIGLPIGYPEKGTIGTLGLSIYLPIGSFIETNSGNPFLPEYVMYRSRHQRTSVYLNFAHKQNDFFAWSLGGILGFQGSADVSTNLDLNGGSTGSWAQAKSKISPSLGAILSGTFKFEKSSLYFTYQQEMKSNLNAHVNGDVVNPSLGLFDANIKSMMFYDPHTFRLGSSYKFSDLEFFTGLEYQLWNSYSPPTIKVIKNGGTVSGSRIYEVIKTKNTFIPKIGIKYALTNRFDVGMGILYRQSPLDSNFSGSGNSIDCDSYILTAGFNYRIVIWSKDVTVGTSFQYHKLKDKTVTKTSGMEDGTNGTKIGGPSYNIGGDIVSSTLGVKFNF